MDSKTIKKLSIVKVIQIALLLLLSFFVVAGSKVAFGGKIYGSLTENYIESFKFTDIFWLLIVFGILYGAFILIKKYYPKIQTAFISEKKIKIKPFYLWLLIIAILLMAWLPYLLSFAPGSVLGDSLSSIEQIYTGVFSNHHPVLYTLLVGFFIKIGNFFGNINIGVFLYSCFQSFLLAGTLGYVVVFLSKQKVRTWFIVLTVAFFAICPIFPSYAIIMWKDPIFSIALLFFSLVLYEYGKKQNFLNLKWYHYALLVFLTLCIAFFRNNGIFILAPAVVLLLLAFKKSALKISATIFITIVFSLIIQGPVYSALKIHKPSVEAFSIPLQQIAYTLSKNEATFSEDDKEFLNDIMPIETWKTAYTPTLVDNIKWHEDFNTSFFESHLRHFLKIWLKQLPSNFGSYVEAYLLETLGFWHPYLQHEYGYIDQYISSNDYKIHEIDLIKKITNVSIKDKLESFRPMIGTGLMIFIALFSLVNSLEFQKKTVTLLYLTTLLCWAVIMISTPVAFSLRYVFVVALSLPILLVAPVLNGKKIKKKDAIIEK